MLIQIADESGNDLVHGAVDYESIVGSGVAVLPPVEPSPDDLYVLYTGGTTGMPKGVLWRQHDIFMTSFGGRNLYTGELANSYEDIAKRVADAPESRLMILPPLMHGAAQWAVMTAMTTGQSVVFSTVTDRFDADEVVRTIEREKVMAVTVVGDAMARPLAAAIEGGTADLSSLAVRFDRRRRRRVLGDRRADDPHVSVGRGGDRQVQRRPGHLGGRGGPRCDPATGS